MRQPAQRTIRRAARVLLTDVSSRLLLFRYVPDDLPAFWLLPGGECEPREDFREAAARELLEETGVSARPRPLGVTRQFDYVYQGQPVRGIEHFFHHRTVETRIDTSGHTELEQRSMQEYRWFTTAELCAWHEPLYPADIAVLIERALLPES